jgi:hypothetical protein
MCVKSHSRLFTWHNAYIHFHQSRFRDSETHHPLFSSVKTKQNKFSGLSIIIYCIHYLKSWACDLSFPSAVVCVDIFSVKQKIQFAGRRACLGEMRNWCRIPFGKPMLKEQSGRVCTEFFDRLSY